MSKAKKVDNPNTDDETHKVLTNEIDTGKVDSEKNSIYCHQFTVTKFVKQDAREKAWSKVYQATNSTNYRNNLNDRIELVIDKAEA